MTTSRQLSRAGLWATGPQQLPLPIEARGLSEVLVASGRLKLTPDYDVLAWLCERWLRRPTETGWMRPSFYEIGWDLYGKGPSGPNYETLRDALDRIASVTVTLDGFNLETGQPDRRLISRSNLLEVSLPGERLEGADRLTVRLAEWLRREIDHGAPLRLDWRILRTFDRNQKLAKRLWVYLAAERWRRQGSGSTEATWIAVGDWLFTALGMDYAQPRQARAALRRACATVMRVDERLGMGRLEIQRQGQRWRLYAERPVERVWAERRQIRATAREALAINA